MSLEAFKLYRIEANKHGKFFFVNKFELGIKLHFNSASYDFIKYNGKVKADLPSFMKRKDKYHFAKLARTYKSELLDFYVANLSLKDAWVGDLLENESKIYVRKKSGIENRVYYW